MRELSLKNCRLDKRYDIIEQLGRGSYAEIFVARDTLAAPQSAHHQVVIKALNVFLQDDVDTDLERTLVENFQNEAIALDRVRHPNIISRMGHGTARDLNGMIFHYLVLEYLAGGDLQRACRERSLTLKAAVGYIEQVCAGLRHAHRQGIIHRDIKPQNLLLTADRATVKIADFGVARVHQSDAPITRVGTNIYAPPEHSPLFAGAEGVMTVMALTPAADIYSLAKSAYTLITCETPRFYANQPITELPLSVRNEDWAPELRRVLNRATSGEPGMRHQSVDEFWADLETVRRIAIESETATHVRPKLHDIPQPHVAQGYTPLAPSEPKFNTTRDLRRKHPLIQNGGIVDRPEAAEPVALGTPGPAEQRQDIQIAPPPQPNLQGIEDPRVAPEPVPRHTSRRMLSRMVMLMALVVVLTGILYGTSVYFRGLDILPNFAALFSSGKEGVAITDINLRPEPNINNQPFGVVTKDSRVRIRETRNDWYYVDVLEQGRVPNEPVRSDQGWVYGEYVDLVE
jgi:serine/threonine protein kinase